MSRASESVEPALDAPAGILPNLHHDVAAGFLVFLIALPLCVGISLASGCPALAGILTAAVGGIVTPFLSNSELTIKGPAAGMIAIVLGAVTAMTPEVAGDPAGAAWEGYRKMLGLAAVSGALQMGLGLLRWGSLGEFFPLPAVQGMLAAIGVVIISKQAHVLLLGNALHGGSFELLAALPGSLKAANSPSGIIGVCGLFFLISHRFIRLRLVQAVPAPIWLLLFGVPAAASLGVPETQLVSLPDSLIGTLAAPDFSGVPTQQGVKWIFMLAFVGSLESVLSAKAVDLLDPWKRRTDLDRDLFAVGLANTAGACIGALPMISEIVRSSASRNYGARTRWANFFHALFLLLVVIAAPGILRLIPLSALAAILVFAGFQLAAPSKFVAMYKTGLGEFAVFLTTVFVTLATDLLFGVCAGVLMQWVLLAHALHANPFVARYQSWRDQEFTHLKLAGPLIFSNWLSFARALGRSGPKLVVDLSSATVVDHSVMRKLSEFRSAWEREGKVLFLEGLDGLCPASADPFARRTGTRSESPSAELQERP